MDKNITGLVMLAIGAFVVWQMSRSKAEVAPAGISNHETWTWTDYKGNERQIVIEREVVIS